MALSNRSSLFAAFTLVLAAGCGDDTTNPGDKTETCAATLTSWSALTPSTHRGTVNANEIWAAADSPHVVEAPLNVLNATLTIEPCAVTLLDPDADINAGVGGNISAVGTLAKPILFAKNGANRWGHLRVDAEGAMTLEYVTISGGGSDLVTDDGATLIADGPTSRPYVNNLDVKHVTITGSAGYGVWIQRHAAFSVGSTDLNIHGAGTDDSTHPSPLRIDAQALTSVPAGNYSGNAEDRIEVDPFTGIEVDATISHYGVPYWISNFTELNVARPFGDAGPIPTLTIEAGVTLSFEPGTNSGLLVGGTSNPPQPGSLAINGSSTAPVTLTSAATAQAPGDWQGVIFRDGAGAGSSSQSITYTTIEFAGGDPSIAGHACASTDSAANVLDEAGAVVIFGWAPAASFVQNSILQHSAGWGVFRGWNSTQGTAVDFAATNTFADLVACEQNDIKATCPGAGSSVVYSCAGTI